MRKITLLSILMSFFSFLNAQNLYTDFNPIIKGYAEVKAMDIQLDNKIIIAGEITTVDSSFIQGIARINPDGSYDETFNFPFFVEGHIYSVLYQSDGKIIISGGEINSELNDIIRLNSDGSIDDSFDSNSDLNHIVKVARQSSGKYIIFDAWNGELKRLNLDGSIDDTFSSVTGFNSYGVDETDLIIQNDNKILISGTFTSVNDESHRGLLRLNVDGTIDETFNIGSGMPDYSSVNSIGIQSNNKIILVGEFDSFNGINVKNIIRLNNNGSVDETFTTPGPSANVFSNSIDDIVILGDDKILISGSDYSSSEWNYKTMMLDANGNLDSGYLISSSTYNYYKGIISNTFLDTTSNKHFVIAGPFIDFNDETRISLAKFSSTGELVDFDAKLGYKPKINSIQVQENNQIIIGGEFFEINRHQVNNYARLNIDGSVDTSFINKKGFSPEREINTIAIQNDNKILLTSNCNDDSLELVRLNSNGSLDESFEAKLYYSYSGKGVKIIKPLINGKIILAGSFSYINNVNINNYAQLNQNGSLNSEFNSSNFLNEQDVIYTLDYQTDTNIIIGGTAWGGSGFIYRTDSLGNIDNTFELNFSLSNTDVRSIKVFNDSSIIVGAQFAQIFPGEPKPVYQLDKDGNIKDSISLSTKGGYIKDIVIKDDSTFFIAGSFNQVNTLDQFGIAEIDLKHGTNKFNLFDQNKVSSINDIHIFNDSILYTAGEFFITSNNNVYSGLTKFTIKNNIPKILSVNSVDSIKEDSSFIFRINEIEISDYDNFINNYTIIIGNGDNYKLSNDTIFPDENYNGSLIIPIKVSDGFDESPTYEFTLKVKPVNDAPIIIGVNTNFETYKNEAITIELSDLNVNDVDNNYPDDFTLTILSGNNYTFEGSTLTPSEDFTGNLTVPLTVNDGTDDSEEYDITIEVILNTAIDDNIQNNDFKVYPTFFDEVLYIEYNSELTEAKVEIFDLQGKIVYSNTINVNFNNIFKINTSKLKKGMYIIKITNNKRVSATQVIK